LTIPLTGPPVASRAASRSKMVMKVDLIRVRCNFEGKSIPAVLRIRFRRVTNK
jgi:hypothetical protein